MKKFLTLILLAVTAALSITVQAQLNGTGYYRIENNYTGRYIYVLDNKGSINYSTTSADMGAIELYQGIERTLYDPATVLYCQNISGKQYDIKAQGTGIYQMIGFYVTLTTDPRYPGTYVAYGSAHGLTKYLFDGISSSALDQSFLSDVGKAECKYWLIHPIDASGDNYFGVKPTVTASNSEYYAPFYAEFPFSFASEGMKACYVTKVDGQRGYAVYKEITGTVPGATPLFIKCNSEDHSNNRLNIGGSATAPTDNIGVGVYFKNDVSNHLNRVTYNPQTMRVLGTMTDGTLALVTENYDYVPRNTFYVNVPAGSPAQFQLVSESEYEEILNSIPIDATGITLSSTSLTLTIGETATLTANVLPEEATNKSVNWTSSNTAVASVDTNGKVTTTGIGSATITATTHNGFSATCQVTVTPVMPASVTLSQTSLALNIGETATLTATVLPADANDKSVSWQTDNANIATVDANGVVTAKAEGTANISAVTVNGLRATCQVTVTSIPVSSISLDQTALSVNVGESATLHATLLPANASFKTVTWTVDNASVATVNSDGVITGKADGTATVTATAHNGLKATCAVTVTAVPVSSITLDNTSLSAKIGETLTLHATLLPANATYKTVTWTVDDANVVSVNADGVVTCNAVGTATVTATAHNGLTATCVVTVTAIEAESITIVPDYISVRLGDTRQLTVNITPSNTTDKTVTWTSADPQIATVDATGLVTPVSMGEVYLTATTHNGLTAQCRVVVLPVLASEVILNETSLTLEVDSEFTLVATVKPDNTTDPTVYFTSYNPNVATVSADGVVTALRGGTAIIEAKCFTSIATCEVTVLKKSQFITWEQDFGEVYDGDKLVLSAVASSGLDVRYEASENASVEGNVLTVLTPGEVRVRAHQDGDDRHEAAEPVELSFNALAGINDAIYDAITIEAGAAQISIKGKPADAEVYVYNMGGAPVYVGTDSCIGLQSNSVYLVVIGGRSFKVVTK